MNTPTSSKSGARFPEATSRARTFFAGALVALATVVAVHADDPASSALPEADVVIADASLAPATRDAQILAARRFYAFWDTGDVRWAELALAANFTDQTLPPGRPQGVSGPPFASKAFRAIVPDLRVHVRQLLVVGDRVVAHLRLTGHFGGRLGDTVGDGRPIDFIATDILRIERGRIVDNWHIEDNASLFRQLGVMGSRR